MLSKLLLAHFIADFYLQPNRLIEFKKKSSWGVFLHVLIVFLVGAFLLFPYWERIEIWLFLALNALIHFFQDSYKIIEEKKNNINFVRSFFFDQLGHITLILIIAPCLGFLLRGFELPNTPFYTDFYLDETIFYVFAAMILGGQGVDLFKFQQLREKNSQLTYHRNIASLSLQSLFIGIVLFSIYAIFKLIF